MEYLLSVILVFLLLAIIYQDFRYRAVSWYIFPLAAMVLIIQILIRNENEWLYVLINTALISTQLIILSCWYFIREKRIFNIINNKIGLADVLLFYVFALAFFPVTYILFISGSFIFSLLLHSLLSNHLKNRSKIPLAAYMAIFYFILQSLFYIKGIDPFDDIMEIALNN